MPTIMKWPGHIPAGRVQDKAAMTIDLLPTIAHLTGANLPDKKIDGKNIWPFISQGSDKDSPQEAYYVYYNRNELQAVIMGKWKLYFPHAFRSLPPGVELRDDGIPVKYQMNQLEALALYNIEEDLAETNNLVDDQPEIVLKMQELAEKARADMGDALQDREGKNLRPARTFSEMDSQ